MKYKFTNIQRVFDPIESNFKYEVIEIVSLYNEDFTREAFEVKYNNHKSSMKALYMTNYDFTTFMDNLIEKFKEKPSNNHYYPYYRLKPLSRIKYNNEI